MKKSEWKRIAKLALRDTKDAKAAPATFAHAHILQEMAAAWPTPRTVVPADLNQQVGVWISVDKGKLIHCDMRGAANAFIHEMLHRAEAKTASEGRFMFDVQVVDMKNSPVSPPPQTPEINSFSERAIRIEASGHTYVIAASNEPDGEGNGWYDCKPEDATMWIVWDDMEDQSIYAAETERDAVFWLADRIAQPKE